MKEIFKACENFNPFVPDDVTIKIRIKGTTKYENVN
jgi:hypothetical protein